MRIRINEKSLQRTQLLRICKYLCIRKYSKLTKQSIALLINKRLSAHYILKCWVKYKNRHKTFINEHDPITQESIERPCYEVHIGDNKYVRYNLLTFYEYLIRTGKFRDPYTDYKFSNDDLILMDKQMYQFKIYKQSLFCIKNNPHYTQYYNQIQQEHDHIIGLERQIGELILEAAYSIHNNNDMAYYIITQIFMPNFYLLLQQMRQINPEYTKSTLQDYKLVIKNYELPGNVIQYLEDVIEYELAQSVY